MASSEIPLSRTVRGEIEEIMTNSGWFEDTSVNSDARMDMERERIYRARADIEARRNRQLLRKPSFTDTLKCMLLPATVLTLTIMMCHKIRQGFRRS